MRNIKIEPPGSYDKAILRDLYGGYGHDIPIDSGMHVHYDWEAKKDVEVSMGEEIPVKLTSAFVTCVSASTRSTSTGDEEKVTVAGPNHKFLLIKHCKHVSVEMTNRFYWLDWPNQQEELFYQMIHPVLGRFDDLLENLNRANPPDGACAAFLIILNSQAEHTSSGELRVKTELLGWDVTSLGELNGGRFRFSKQETCNAVTIEVPDDLIFDCGVARVVSNYCDL